MPEFDPLGSDIRTDVLIIGGGITGLLCARQLADANVDYVLVEADRICGGITSIRNIFGFGCTGIHVLDVSRNRCPSSYVSTTISLYGDISEVKRMDSYSLKIFSFVPIN